MYPKYSFRENKNRYVFSFLAALVDMQIVASVEIDFMLVGHTGNQVVITKYLAAKTMTPIKTRNCHNPGQSKAELSNLEWYYYPKVPLLVLPPPFSFTI